ncbi:efflux transporter outer membrane subunit [Rubritalea spongiae]|uniref:Efflux transporter outer membrane subunit n=1 Tax=Rubritalea spongiae TaxID=430797 RepID=A0ABW5E534_9BACT
MHFHFVRSIREIAIRGIAVCSVAGCSVLLIACAAKPPESQMLKVEQMAPNSWSATKEGKAGVDRDWVASFKDKQLSNLVDEAMARNTDMRAQAERVAQARQNAYLAGAAARPTLAAEINGDRSQRQFVGFPFGGSSIQNGSYADLRMNWEIDLWGRIRMGQTAAISDAQAAELDQKAAEAALAAEVCKAWFALGEAGEQLELAQEVVRIRKSSVESIADRFERNLGGEGGSASQLRLAQTDLATAESLVSQRMSDMALAKRRLELLCGRYPEGKLKGSNALTKMPKSPPSGVPSSLLQRRPDVVAAERRYAAAVSRVKEAKRAIFPIISLTGSYGTASDALEQIVNNNFSTWSIGGTLVQNILTGGRVKGEIELRNSKEREELAKLEGVVLKAFSEVENALVVENWLSKRVKDMQRAYDLSKEAAKAANDDFLDGTGDVLTLLSAQRSAVDIGASLLTLKRMQLDNRVDLHLALGGEFRFKGK